MGRLIVFEGIDGSGKSTQFERLCKTLEEEKTEFRRLRFPQYSKPSSTLLRMYLNGEFGSRPDDVNAYAASAFYAVDRVASYLMDWRDYYNDGGILLADRYTTSNAIHQGSKLDGAERLDYLSWLYEFEFDRLGLPRPDAVIYMEIPVELSVAHINKRAAETGAKADIHELDVSFLKRSRECGLQAAELYGWKVIYCAPDGVMRTIDDIAEEIYGFIHSEVL